MRVLCRGHSLSRSHHPSREPRPQTLSRIPGAGENGNSYWDEPTGHHSNPPACAGGSSGGTSGGGGTGYRRASRGAHRLTGELHLLGVLATQHGHAAARSPFACAVQLVPNFAEFDFHLAQCWPAPGKHAEAAGEFSDIDLTLTLVMGWLLQVVRRWRKLETHCRGARLEQNRIAVQPPTQWRHRGGKLWHGAAPRRENPSVLLVLHHAVAGLVPLKRGGCFSSRGRLAQRRL